MLASMKESEVRLREAIARIEKGEEDIEQLREHSRRNDMIALELQAEVAQLRGRIGTDRLRIEKPELRLENMEQNRDEARTEGECVE